MHCKYEASSMHSVTTVVTCMNWGDGRGVQLQSQDPDRIPVHSTFNTSRTSRRPIERSQSHAARPASPKNRSSRRDRSTCWHGKSRVCTLLLLARCTPIDRSAGSAYHYYSVARAPHVMRVAVARMHGPCQCIIRRRQAQAAARRVALRCAARPHGPRARARLAGRARAAALPAGWSS